MKKEPNSKSFDILFAYSNFVLVQHNMSYGHCLCHVDVIVHDQSFFVDFIGFPLFVVNMMVQVATPYIIVFVSYNCFCKHL